MQLVSDSRLEQENMSVLLFVHMKLRNVCVCVLNTRVKVKATVSLETSTHTISAFTPLSHTSKNYETILTKLKTIVYRSVQISNHTNIHTYSHIYTMTPLV